MYNKHSLKSNNGNLRKMGKPRALRLVIIVCAILFVGLTIDYLVIGPFKKHLQEPDQLFLLQVKMWLVVVIGFIAALLFIAATQRGTKHENKRNPPDSDGHLDGSFKSALGPNEMGGDFDHLSIFENFNLGILCVDNEGDIVKTNAEFCRKTGYTEHDLIGNKAVDILGEKDMSETDALRNRKAGKSEIYEHSIGHKDGTSGRYFTAGMPLFDRFGNPKGSIGVVLDVSDFHEYREKLEQALQIEKELGEAKSHFVATASHQFRTPLSIIQANAELMFLLMNKVDSKQAEIYAVYIDRIKKEISHMTGIMEEVLILEKIATGNLKLNKSKVYIDEILLDIKENLVIQDDRIIQITIKGKKQHAHIDIKLIHESVINLVTNALKYSSEENPMIEINYQKEQFEVRVSDTGVGIPKDEIPKLFESFFRASNVNNVQGTGLGLKISREYVELHGGTLAIESEENKGTTAIINLPYGKSE